MKRKKKRKWLYEQYKLEHPEIFPKQKRRMKMPYIAWKICDGMLVFIIFNALAILIAAAISADIRAFIF